MSVPVSRVDPATVPVRGGRPLVAMTATLREYGTRPQPAVVINASYLDALEAAGLAPVLLTPAHSPASLRNLLQLCGGLVLTGGEDVDPARYGATPHPALGTLSPARDELEWQALDSALELRLPVLAICRGIQVLNAYFGGTLYQDLPTERPGAIDHNPPIELGTRVHGVTIAVGSRLHNIVRCAALMANSTHHQAVRTVAPALVATAHAADGVVEAVEARSGEWIMGVQWHPERIPDGSPPDDPDRLLLQAFRRAVLEFLAAGSGPGQEAEPSGHA